MNQKPQAHPEAGGNEKTDPYARQREGEGVFRGFARSPAIEQHSGNQKDSAVPQPPQQPRDNRLVCQTESANQRIHPFIDKAGKIAPAKAGQGGAEIGQAESQQKGQASAEGNRADSGVKDRAAADEEENHQSDQRKDIDNQEQRAQPQLTGVQHPILHSLHGNAEAEQNGKADNQHRKKRNHQRRQLRGQTAEKHRFPADGQGMEQIHAALVVQIPKQRDGENQGEQPQQRQNKQGQNTVQKAGSLRGKIVFHRHFRTIIGKIASGLCDGERHQKGKHHREDGGVKKGDAADLAQGRAV